MACLYACISSALFAYQIIRMCLFVKAFAYQKEAGTLISPPPDKYYQNKNILFLLPVIPVKAGIQ